MFSEIDILTREVNKSSSSLHKHHYFELIYVLSGNGTHIINSNHFTFTKGDLFLLTPDDAHTFKITTPTEFCIIDFTKTFFSKNSFRNEEKMNVPEFFKKLEYIFHNHHSIEGSLTAQTKQPILKPLILQLLKEAKSGKHFTDIIKQNIILLLLHLVARIIQERPSAGTNVKKSKANIHEIISFIQHNIYDNEQLRISSIASEFNKTPDYLNRYFKAETGITLKEYIIHYKLNLIKTRLVYSTLTISEIANEMNFTDESHLNKTFKKQFGITAKQFRKSKAH